MKAFDIRHSQHLGGYGNDDVPPPPPSWLTEGLAVAGTYDEQGYSGQTDTWRGPVPAEGDPQYVEPQTDQYAGEQYAPEQYGDDQQAIYAQQQDAGGWTNTPLPVQQDPNAGYYLQQEQQPEEQFGAGLGGGYSDEMATRAEGVAFPPSAFQNETFGQSAPPPPPPAAPMLHTPAVEAAAGFQAPSIASLKNRRSGLDESSPDAILLSPVSEPENLPPPPSNFGGGLSMEGFNSPPPAAEQSAPGGGSPHKTALYTGTLGTKPGDVAPAVNKDGVPNYVPEIPETFVEPGALGRRVAGGAWGLLFILHAAVAFQEGNIPGAMIVLIPLLILTLLLFTGKSWAGVLGIIGSCLLGLAFTAFGLFLLAANSAISTMLGLVFPPIYGIVLTAFGLLFILGNILMLVGAPTFGRAMAGAFVMILPLLGVTAVFAMVKPRPRLTKPLDSTTAMVYGSNDEGFVVKKPEGWQTYDWELVSAISPLGMGLTTTPAYFFINPDQDMMVSIYKAEPQRRSLSDLFKPEDITPLEKEISRALPPSGQAETFEYNGVKFTELSFQGALENGSQLSIIMDKGELPGQLFYIVVTRDMSTRTTQEEEASALDDFFQTLQFPGVTAEETPTE